MKITKTFGLVPTLKDGVWYIEVDLSVSADSTDDKKRLVRWHRFSTKSCAGKDALGKYYDTKDHAQRTIRSFKSTEKERSAA